MSDKDIAENMMNSMKDGKDITVDYNKLSLEQQQAVYTEMRNLKDNDFKKDFGNLTLSGSEDDRLADAQRTKGLTERIGSLGFGPKTQDVYDSPQDIQAKLETHQKRLTDLFSGGETGEGIVKNAGDNLTKHNRDVEEALDDSK